jgi:hypothetical protein
MQLEQMSFAIESMFPGIRGGSDYLLQASVDQITGFQNPDAEIYMWDLPIEQPTKEQIEDFFLQVKEEYEKTHNEVESEQVELDRKQKVIDSFLGKYGN